MENRLLYLEKELSIVRKKLNILETNIQNDMKNYVDHYMQVYLEQLDINVQKSDDQVKPPRKQAKRKLKNVKKTEGKTISPKILDTRCVKKEEEDLIKNDDGVEDNVRENEFENNKTWPNQLKEDNAEYIIVEEDEENSIIVEVKEGEIMQSENDTGEYSGEFEVIEDNGEDPLSDITVTKVSSLSNTSCSIPKILSVARNKATYQAEVAASSPSTPSSFTPKPSTSKESSRFPYECPICQEVFKCASHFGKHKIKHLPDRPYKCELCGKAYKRSHHLKEHQTLSHPTEKNKVLESGRGSRCTKCQKVFSRPSLLAAHEQTHSKEEAHNKAGNGKNTNILTPQFHGFTLNL